MKTNKHELDQDIKRLWLTTGLQQIDPHIQLFKRDL